MSESIISEIQKLWGLSFFSKYSKFNLDYKNAEKDPINFFCFRDNYIWICIVKLSLLTKKYSSSEANVLIRSPKISHVNNRDFFEQSFLARDQWIWERCCDADFSNAWARLQYWLSKHPPKWDFLEIYLTTFSQSITSKIQNLWGSTFDSKFLKFNLNFKNAAKNSERVFSFSDNCIWIGIVKLSLLRTQYFSSAANVLTSSPKILHVNKRDFFQLSWFWQWSMNMLICLWCRFQQCLGTFIMLLVEGSSETWLFRQLSNHVLGVCNFGNTKAVRVIFLFKIFKI